MLFRITIWTTWWPKLNSDFPANLRAVMIAKEESERLPGKNFRQFKGAPLFEHNLRKLLRLFGSVIFDSDSEHLLEAAKKLGATPHLRSAEVRGNDIPSVEVLQGIVSSYPECLYFLNVQANSPGITDEIIIRCAQTLSLPDVAEVLTCYPNGQINGSAWGLTRGRIRNYGNPYLHLPDILIIDASIDIHTQKDFEKAEAV